MELEEGVSASQGTGDPIYKEACKLVDGVGRNRQCIGGWEKIENV